MYSYTLYHLGWQWCIYVLRSQNFSIFSWKLSRYWPEQSHYHTHHLLLKPKTLTIPLPNPSSSPTHWSNLTRLQCSTMSMTDMILPFVVQRLFWVNICCSLMDRSQDSANTRYALQGVAQNIEESLQCCTVSPRLETPAPWPGYVRNPSFLARIRPESKNKPLIWKSRGLQHRPSGFTTSTMCTKPTGCKYSPTYVKFERCDG